MERMTRKSSSNLVSNISNKQRISCDSMTHNRRPSSVNHHYPRPSLDRVVVMSPYQTRMGGHQCHYFLLQQQYEQQWHFLWQQLRLVSSLSKKLTVSPNSRSPNGAPSKMYYSHSGGHHQQQQQNHRRHLNDTALMMTAGLLGGNFLMNNFGGQHNNENMGELRSEGLSLKSGEKVLPSAPQSEKIDDISRLLRSIFLGNNCNGEELESDVRKSVPTSFFLKETTVTSACEAHQTPKEPGDSSFGTYTSFPNISTTMSGNSTNKLTPNSSITGMKPRNVMIHRLRSIRGRNLTDKYNVEWDTVLGEGAYGSVHPARLKVTGEKVALKKISRHVTNASTFQTETAALLRLYDNGGHPNISGLRDMYEDHSCYYLILDLVTGGEMFEHLINYGAYSEADAARLMHEIASALAFLHGVGIVHMDLKPENLLLSTKNRLDGTIKVIDFGCAYVTDDDQVDLVDNTNSNAVMSTTGMSLRNQSSSASTGTTAYWSPERFAVADRDVINQGDHEYVERIPLGPTPAMDMWSVGVILYIMLTGVHPFDIEGRLTDQEIEEQIKKDPTPPLTPELVGHLSESAVDLIVKLMEKDPTKRLTAYQMMHHPWVRGETASTEKIQDVDKKLSHFKDIRSKLEAVWFELMLEQGYADARMSEYNTLRLNKTNDPRAESTTHIMQKAFLVFDGEAKGYVTYDDMGRIVSERTGKTLSADDTKEFLQAAAKQVSASPSAAATSTEDTNIDTPAYLSLTQFNKLFSGLNHKHFPRGHYIFHAGEDGDAMYFISSGKVEIQTRKGQLVALLRSGDFFGEGSLLDPSHLRFTSAKCATPVDVIEIKRKDFDRYIGASATAKRDIQVKWRARSLQYAKNLLRLQTNVLAKNYKKGDVIYKEGDLGTSMYRVDEDNGGVLVVSHGGKVVHKYLPGDSFGESSLLFQRPRSSTVTCASDTCRLLEMKGEDFLALIESSPEMASILRNTCRKRLFKKAVKAYSLELDRGFSDDDIVAAFHDADVDRSGSLNLDEVRRLMHRMDPQFPMSEIVELLKFVDVDEDGQITLEEFKLLFRQFDEAKEETKKADV